MSKDMIKNLIDLVPEQDLETIYKVIVKFIPEEAPMEDEIIAIAEAKADYGNTVKHSAMNWD